MAISTQTPIIKLAGAELQDGVAADLRELRIERSVQRTGSATMRFEDERFELVDADVFKVGTKLEVLFHSADNALVSAFEGCITTIGVSQAADGSLPVMEVVAHDASHRLVAASLFKAYLDRSPADVVREIAGRHGLRAEIVGADTVVPYLVQSGSDHRFVGELATMLGHEWFTSGDALHFRPRPTAADGPTLKRSAGLRSFSTSYAGMSTPRSVTVHSWDPSAQQTITGTAGALTSSPAPLDLGSNATFVADQHARARQEFGRDLTVSTTTARDGPEADALASSIARRLIAAGVHVEGVHDGNPEIRPGGTVRIEEVGTKLEGDYYVTDVVHEFGPSQQVVTRFWSAGHEIENAGTGGSGGASLPGDLDGWGQRGLLTAVVTNNNDPEKLGRVKLRFPSLGGTTESDWARVVMPGGGLKRGLDLRPEVDDEVVVGFERGDPRAPFVLGGMFHGKAAPFDAAAVAKGKVEHRVLASRAGHSVTLADGAAADGRFVEIALADGKTKVTIGEEGITIEAAKDTPLALKTGGASLTLTQDEKLVIKAKEVTVTSDGNLTLKANQAASIKASTGVKIDGGSAFEAKGAQAKVEGSAMTTIKGGMVKIN